MQEQAANALRDSLADLIVTAVVITDVVLVFKERGQFGFGNAVLYDSSQGFAAIGLAKGHAGVGWEAEEKQYKKKIDARERSSVL